MFDSISWNGYEANIWKLYIFRMIFGFFMAVPIIVVFWQKNGLSMFEVMLLQSLFGFTVILLEVPSGYFADRFGRRKTLIMASIFGTLGIAGYSLGTNFAEFIVGETLWAFGVSLVSGANPAIFYDTLVELDMEDRYKELWGKSQSFFMFSSAVAAAIGGVIAGFKLRWALYAQVPVFALMLPFAYSLKEPEHHKEVSEEESMTMKAVFTDVLDKPDLRNIIFYGALIYAVLQTSFMFYQPYFQLTGLKIAMFGFAFAGFNLISAFGSKYAYQVEKRIGKKYSLILLALVLGSSLLFMSQITVLIGIIFIAFQQIVRGFSKPLISDYINEIIGSENRSTILSIHNLFGKLFMSLGTPVFGYISDLLSLPKALLILGITTFILAAILLIFLAREKVL